MSKGKTSKLWDEFFFHIIATISPPISENKLANFFIEILEL